MKKLFIILVLILFFSLSFLDYKALAINCKYEDGSSIDVLLNNCKPSKVVGGQDYKAENGLKEKVNSVVKNISLLIGIIAVGILVYAGFLMQISAGDDEKIKRAKDIIKWAIVGFLLLISVGGIIYIVINIMYAVGKTGI